MIIRTIAILCVFNYSFSQELHFHSEIEKEIFTGYRKDSTIVNFFKSLSAIDSTVTDSQIISYKKQVDDFITTLPAKEQKVNREQKRVKKIYDKIHQRFFKQYLVEAYFPDIFVNANYNCVSATALYAYIFDKTNVPYAIKESPGHVYMIAYPSTYKIYLETTVPGVIAFKEFQPSQIKATIDQLVASKLISTDTLRIKGYDKSFYDYFYNNEDLEVNQLIGIQYYNKGITAYNQQNYDQAEKYLLKAQVFYNPEIVNYLLKGIMLYNLSQMEFGDIESIDYFVNSCNKMILKEDYELNDAKSFVYKFLMHDDIDEQEILKATSLFKKLNDSVVKSETLEASYHYLAEKLSNEGNIEKGIKYAKKLRTINPKNKSLKSIFGYNLTRKFSILPLSKSSLDTINSYIEEHPFLEEDSRVVSFKFTLLLQSTHNSYRQKDITSGEILRKRMETYYEKKKNLIQVNPDAIAETYRAIGSYYYGKKQYALAIKIYKKGLSYAPEHVKLKQLLKWAKEDQ